MSDFSESSKPPAVEIDVPAESQPQHIADQLIAERGEKLVNSRFWPILKPILYRILHYREAVRMIDDLEDLSGQDGLDYTSSNLNLNIEATGLDRIPRTGAFILVANHPTGIADGIAVFDALKAIRRDVAIFTNRDAIRISTRLIEVLIPVEWREQYRTHAKTRETLAVASRAFQDGKVVVIFAAGRIAYWKGNGLIEREWQPSIVTLARKHKAPVIPVHVAARNSWLFYWFAGWNTELRDMTVFHELLNKRGKTFKVTIGNPIPVDRLQGENAQLTERLKHHCVKELPADPDCEFLPVPANSKSINA